MSKEYIECGTLESKAVYMHGFGENKYVPLKAIRQAKAADVVEVKHGRWVNERMTVGGLAEQWAYDCSECGKADGSPFRPKFCPNCGARMDGE